MLGDIRVFCASNAVLAHLVRAEGYSGQASFGVALGGGLNILLDSVFIFGFHLEITGAAIATMFSNLIEMLYFMVLILRKCGRFHLTLNPRYYSVSDGIPKEVLLVGFPSSIMNVMGIFSISEIPVDWIRYRRDGCRA